MSHCTGKHNMDLNAWYKPPNVGFQWGNIILSIGTTLKQIWDHFMIWLHHHNITSKNCKCRTVGQRSSTVQCDIVPPWYLGIIVSILIVEKHLSKTILDKFHLFFIFEKSQTVIFQSGRTVWHAAFFWLSYFWTKKPGRWHRMFFVIVLT